MSSDDSDDDVVVVGTQSERAPSEDAAQVPTFLPPAKRNKSKSHAQSVLVSPVLTKSLSSRITSNVRLFLEQGISPVANMDTFRDCAMLNELRSSSDDEDKTMWYEWASPAHPNEYDGSYNLLLSKLSEMLPDEDDDQSEKSRTDCGLLP